MIDFDGAIAAVRVRANTRLVAVDGLPVSGKTTLAERFATDLGAQYVSLDDFVRPQAEWVSRDMPAFPFGYVRYDDFLDAVRTLARGENCRFRPYDWSTGGPAAEERVVSADQLIVVEGVSALHPELAPLYDVRFWVESDAATTLTASLERGVGDWEREWRELFLPSVELYLATNPRERADFVVAGRGAALSH